jgi:hypothetical protein
VPPEIPGDEPVKRILFAIALTFSVPLLGRAQTAIPTPEQFFGFQMGTDGKLARWDKIVDYMRQVSNASDRVRFRELGKSTNGNPFVALEISRIWITTSSWSGSCISRAARRATPTWTRSSATARS